MMTDGVAANGAEARVLDIAELLVERLGLNPTPVATPAATP
jgi:hypothetical protein